MKELVIFDLDETLIKGQSQKLFLRYLLSTRQIGYFFYLKLLPWFVFYKIGFVKEPEKPMRYALSFLKGRSVESFSIVTHNFFETKLKRCIYPQAVNIIQEHKRCNREVILVSSAIEPIVQEVSRHLDVSRYICTIPEKEDGNYTGIVKNILYGDRKAKALREFSVVNGFDFKNVWAYGDHISDQPLLSLVGHPVAVNPSPRLLREAKERKWEIVFWRQF